MTPDYAAARNLDLPAPDGVGEHGSRAWRLSSGEWLWAGPDVVRGRDIDELERDAYAALAACAWARSVGGTGGGAC